MPDGYVVTVPALAAWLPAATRLRLEAVVADAAGVDEAARGARALIEAEPIGAELDGAVRGRPPPARGAQRARRRACARRDAQARPETRPTRASPASSTLLGIRGADAVLAHVRRCWASLYTARSLEYRRRHGLPAHTDDLAVGVLELVDARTSGVLFTVDPVSGDRGRMVVEASWGLGECVVAGRVTPDRWVADRAGAVHERRISHKARWSVLDEDEAAGGVVERPMPPGLAGEPCLSDAEVAALCAQAAAIEAQGGRPAGRRVGDRPGLGRGRRSSSTAP